MNKKSFALGLIILALSVWGVFATDNVPWKSEFSTDIDNCLKKRAEGQAKTITEFLCPGGTLSVQEVAYQVVMDRLFQKIDKEIESNLKTMYSGEEKDIGKIASTISNWFDYTSTDHTYPTKYEEICNRKAMEEVMKHFGSIVTDQWTPGYITGQVRCSKLVQLKLEAYKKAGWLMGESAIVRSYTNDKHDYVVKLKDKYEKFLNKWTIYLGQMATIKDKWNKKLKTK